MTENNPSSEVLSSICAQNKSYLYTPDELMKLNHPDLSNLNMKLSGLFRTINEKTGQHDWARQRDVRANYPNPYNCYFNKRRIRPKMISCKDPETIKRIRAILSKVSTKNLDEMTIKLSDFIKSSKVGMYEMCTLIYGNFIDSVFLFSEVYYLLLLKLEKESFFPELMYCINQFIVDQAESHHIFKTGTFSESAEEKTKRWAISNGLIVTHLFLKEKYSPFFFYKSLLHWLENCNPENTLGLEIVMKLLPLIRRHHLNTKIIEKLETLQKDKSYPTRIRFLLEIKK